MRYYEGNGVPKSPQEALVWFRRAAERKLPAALAAIAAMTEHNEIGEMPTQTPLDLYVSAANAGNAEAAVNLAVMYLRGQGVARDDRQAVSWLQKAADSGDPVGETRLGMMYLVSFALYGTLARNTEV